MLEKHIATTSMNLSKFLGGYLLESIEDLYQWDFDVSAAENLIQCRILGDNDYQRTIHLRSLLTSKVRELNSSDDILPYAKYIIEDWGGVRGNKNIPKLIDLYLDSKHVPKISGISSISKFLSIRYPTCWIYDSRVAYAINAINYLYGNYSSYMPSPIGRSTKVDFINIETLYNLKNASLHEVDLSQKLFASNFKKNYQVPEKDTYQAFCSIVSTTSYLLNTNPINVEILLFSITDHVLNCLLEKEGY